MILPCELLHAVGHGRIIDAILHTAQRRLRRHSVSMQKDIIDKIRKKGGDFLIELKANQPSLRYGVEDRLEGLAPGYTYTDFLRRPFHIENTEYTILWMVSRLRAALVDLRLILSS